MGHHRSFFMEERIYSVSELAREIKRIIEQFIPPVWVEGEVSNYSQSRAGHIYFSLKDEDSLINCIIWRNIAYSIPFQISNGMRIIVSGTVTTYAGGSQYQINVKQIRPVGIGSLYLAFEALKEKLLEEGLFAAERKRPLPQFPQRIGVVTSATGAAIQDILRISKRRNPAVQIVIFPAIVQGKEAGATIVLGIETFNRLKNVDIIIIGRGGGSLEDLWAFNEEKVVRAVAVSTIPVVSAVGHEVDFALSDFAADLRAPTPSAAAELTVPQRSDFIEYLQGYRKNYRVSILNRLSSLAQKLDALHRRLKANRPLDLVRFRIQRIDELERRLVQVITLKLESQRLRLDTIINTLKILDPKDILQRGFAIVYQLPVKTVIKSVSQVEPEMPLIVEVSDGQFNARVEKRITRKGSKSSK